MRGRTFLGKHAYIFSNVNFLTEILVKSRNKFSLQISGHTNCTTSNTCLGNQERQNPNVCRYT